MLAWMSLAGAGSSAAQVAATPPAATPAPPTKGTGQAPGLRLEWEFDSLRGNYQNICGRVLNERDTAARHVTINFDGFDGEGKKVSSRFGEVVGDVPSRGYAIFCLMVKAGAAKYVVSVPGVDWGPAGQ
jgi:hypothetical protein